MPWKTPREELLRTAVDLVMERGYDLGTMATSMVDMHYVGRQVKHQTTLFDRDLRSLVVSAQIQKRTAEYRTFNEMVEQLQAEGWKWLGIGDGAGIWQHQSTGWTVNNGGGVWSYEEATRRTFGSTSRTWLLELAQMEA